MNTSIEIQLEKLELETIDKIENEIVDLEVEKSTGDRDKMLFRKLFLGWKLN